MHEPLSQSLQRVLDPGSTAGGITLGDLHQRIGPRGRFLFIIVLCLPFVLPVSVPGMSTPLGLAMIVITAGMLRRQHAPLPSKLACRHLPPKLCSVLLRGGVRFLRVIEKLVRPRRTFWMSWPVAVWLNAFVLMFMALLLALPLPPIPPLTNMLPSYCILLLALSMMEEDGWLVWLAYVASAATTFYFAWWAKEIAEHFAKWGHHLIQWLGT